LKRCQVLSFISITSCRALSMGIPQGIHHQRL
jgi:hypothetical protein